MKVKVFSGISFHSNLDEWAAPSNTVSKSAATLESHINKFLSESPSIQVRDIKIVSSQSEVQVAQKPMLDEGAPPGSHMHITQAVQTVWVFLFYE